MRSPGKARKEGLSLVSFNTVTRSKKAGSREGEEEEGRVPLPLGQSRQLSCSKVRYKEPSLLAGIKGPISKWTRSFLVGSVWTSEQRPLAPPVPRLKRASVSQEYDEVMSLCGMLAMYECRFLFLFCLVSGDNVLQCIPD